MRKELERALDKIESRIGKRDDFLVEDVFNYFLQDEGIIEMSMDELEYYARTGERIDEPGVFEFDNTHIPGIKYQGKYMTYDRSLLLTKEFLKEKYGKLYIRECEDCRRISPYMEWVEAQGIVVATLDYKHIFCIDSTIPWIYEESGIVQAFRCMRKPDIIEFPDEKSQQEKRASLLNKWDYLCRKDCFKPFS